MYTRKTRDEWQIHANYGGGWEHETSYDSRYEAKEDLRLYRENAPQYSYRLVKKRVKITATK